MDFSMSARAQDLKERLQAFVDEKVEPATPIYFQQIEESGDKRFHPPIMEELKAEARARGLWNLFLPNDKWGPGLTNVEYAPLAEIMGRNYLSSEATNCAAPDTGNMEVLAEFGTPEQQDQWLVPLLEGEIRSCFAMTEPWVASSDATNITSRIERDGDHYIVNAHKWWTSGALSPRCRVAILMGVSDPDADPHRRHSQILVPMDAPGVTVVRGLTVFGHDAGAGHAETLFENVRLPASSIIGGEGNGFAIAQARLGPGRIHHCMRAIGLAEKALELMCMRAQMRVAFGKPLADQGVVRDRIAESRMEIEQARLLTLKAAWLMDTVGVKGARIEISAIKVLAARTATNVIDRAIQLFGGAGVSSDWPLADMYAHARTLHLVDGPDDVHKMQIARREIARFESLRP
ncbi:MAG: acyl-CoA dehydrogenase family protein [Acidimicrobiia bacterium]|nr:acyl-CoA dehydrogenase family protein [Acidimicrobiia bacterium]MBJ7513209.1 acyl-CoA dehydrogenase family protein [Acidimicrobiia bacterium]